MRREGGRKGARVKVRAGATRQRGGREGGAGQRAGASCVMFMVRVKVRAGAKTQSHVEDQDPG